MIVSAQSDCKAIYFTQDHSNLIKCFVEYMFAVGSVTSWRIAILKPFYRNAKVDHWVNHVLLLQNSYHQMIVIIWLKPNHYYLLMSYWRPFLGSYWNSLSQITALFGPKETWLCQALLYNSRQRWLVSFSEWSPCNWLFQIVGVLTKTSTLLESF